MAAIESFSLDCSCFPSRLPANPLGLAPHRSMPTRSSWRRSKRGDARSLAQSPGQRRTERTCGHSARRNGSSRTNREARWCSERWSCGQLGPGRGRCLSADRAKARRNSPWARVGIGRAENSCVPGSPARFTQFLATHCAQQISPRYFERGSCPRASVCWSRRSASCRHGQSLSKRLPLRNTLIQLR